MFRYLEVAKVAWVHSNQRFGTPKNGTPRSLALVMRWKECSASKSWKKINFSCLSTAGQKLSYVPKANIICFTQFLAKKEKKKGRLTAFFQCSTAKFIKAAIFAVIPLQVQKGCSLRQLSSLSLKGLLKSLSLMHNSFKEQMSFMLLIAFISQRR